MCRAQRITHQPREELELKVAARLVALGFNRGIKSIGAEHREAVGEGHGALKTVDSFAKSPFSGHDARDVQPKRLQLCRRRNGCTCAVGVSRG